MFELTPISYKPAGTLAKVSGLEIKKDYFSSCLRETVRLQACVFHKEHDWIPRVVGLEESWSHSKSFSQHR